jgi:hypothetical protein
LILDTSLILLILDTHKVVKNLLLGYTCLALCFPIVSELYVKAKHLLRDVLRNNGYSCLVYINEIENLDKGRSKLT